MNTNKPCLFCKEEILKDATICKHCGKKQTVSFIKRIGQFILFIFLLGVIVSAFSSSSDTSTSKENIQISESQCQSILKDLYLVSSGKKHPQESDPEYKVTVSLLEQKAFESGLSVSAFTSPNTEYILPKSACGQDLDTLLGVIATGEKNARK